MSRIHEALKRAEQERTMPLGVPPIMPDTQTQTTEPLPEASAMPSMPPPGLVDPLGHTGAEVRTGAAEFLRFDDVWSHCAAPGWRLNLERNVFVDPEIPASVREQFRTL